VTADRCRWHEDPGGRCGEPIAFPAAEEAPPFCAWHLLKLEPWIRSRAARSADAEDWIRWAKAKADGVEDGLKMVGVLRPPRLLADGRPARPGTPERR
jgi:hypothetical protein